MERKQNRNRKRKQMTQQDAKLILEKWITQKQRTTCGTFTLPIVDEVVYTVFDGNTMTDYTFIYLLKTAYPSLTT